MVLTKDRLQELNRYMLGLGAPIERDDVGYSKPDFGLMEGIGRFLHEMNDEMAYAVSDRLQHYKNTQLTEIANDLDETVAYYKKKVNDAKPMNFRNLCDDYAVTDFTSCQAHLKCEDGKVATLYFDDKLFLPNLNLPYWTEVHWADSDYKDLEIPIKRLPDFMERIKDYGKYGYEPDPTLKLYIDNTNVHLHRDQQPYD